MASLLLKPFYFFLVLLLLSFSAKAQSHKNISLGSSLTTLNNDNSPWVSPSGEFAFGFQQIENDGFLLAIWFKNIPERTVVWSANPNDLAQRGSKLELTADGQLVLYDPKCTLIWSPQLTDTGVAYTAMLDTGNFVLATKDSIDVWGSFDQPRDTLLPTQIMNQGSKLVARYLDTNYSTGRFQFTLQADGNLILYTNNYPQDTSNFAYWASDSVGSGYQLIFNQSGYVYLGAKNGRINNTVFSDVMSSEDFYQRATIDSDGVFRHYLYLKSSANIGKWHMGWTALLAIPENICTRIEADTSSRACGYNSYCVMGDDQKPSFLCPKGYTFMDPNDIRMGCIPNFVQQDCEDESKEADAFDFYVLPKTNWPFSDYEHFNQVSEDWCRKNCLSDCFCAGSIFEDGNCWKKRLPLSNGRMDPTTGGKALIKVRKDNSTSSSASKKKDHSTLILVESLLLGSSTFVIVLFLILTAVYFFRASRKKTRIGTTVSGQQ